MESRELYLKTAMAAFLAVAGWFVMEGTPDGTLGSTIAALAFLAGFISVAFYGSASANRALLWWHTRGYRGERHGR